MLKFHSPPPRGRLTSRLPPTRLLLLDRDAALADLDFDAGGLLVLVDHVADDGGADGEDGDDDGAGLAAHGGNPDEVRLANI